MGEGDTRPRAWEAGESSRDAKTPRLDLLAATALEVDDLGWEKWPEATGDSDRCNHVPTDSAHKEILDSSLQSDDAGKCKGCQRDQEHMNSRILVCLECGWQSCGDSAGYIPYGHAQDHAKQEQHWVAAMFADPQTGFCFKCESEVPVYPEEEEMTGQIQSGGQSGGHAFGLDHDVSLGLVSGLLNLGDTWHDQPFGSTNVQGYAIRGIPNRGNTCYVNAMVQCLLVLDKLRERILGPDGPSGHLGLALMEIFLETSVADAVGAMLNPDKLLRSIRLHADKFEAYKMHDSYELLGSLHDALHNEENEIVTSNRKSGAPTVIDSIFRGEISYKRSCLNCGSSTVSYDQFCELSLPLPSKEHPSRSAAGPQISGSLISQPKKDTTQLIPANDKSASEKIQAVAENNDSHLLGSELKDEVMEKTPEPLEVDSSETQPIWQSNDVVQEPLQTQEDKVSCSELSRGITEAPLISDNFLPHNLTDVKVEQVIEMTTDSHSPDDMGPPPLSENDNSDPGDLLNQLEVSIQAKENTCTVRFTAEDNGNVDKEVVVSNYVPSIEDCLSQFFEEQKVERVCGDCPEVLEEPSTNQIENGKQMVVSSNTAVGRNQTEQSDRLTCKFEQSMEPNSLSVECKSSSSGQPDNSDAKSEITQTGEANKEGINSGMSYGDKEIECHDGIQEAVSSCLPAKKQTNLMNTLHDQNLSMPNQDRRKQVGLDLSASQLGDSKNEQKPRSGCSMETPRITKLPPALILHLKRYTNDGKVPHKNEAHVSYKEYLDVGQFMDPSSVDKDECIYRLAGVVEHRGGLSMDAGHYVAYVRARRHGNLQHSSCSSSWFCADDSYIREVTLEEVLKREAYILFYEKMEG